MALHGTRYTKNPDFVSRRIADELLLVPIRRFVGEVDSLYALNEVAARVWELLDGARPVASVRDAIVAEFDVSESDAERDVGLLIDQLSGIGAIRAAGR